MSFSVCTAFTEKFGVDFLFNIQTVDHVFGCHLLNCRYSKVSEALVPCMDGLWSTISQGGHGC